MSGISQIQKGLKELVIDNCWEYLRDNFHKLNENNKIKVSMALCTKSIPQKIEGDQGPAVVIMGEIKRSDGSPLRYNLGSRISTEVIADSTEAVSDN